MHPELFCLFFRSSVSAVEFDHDPTVYGEAVKRKKKKKKKKRRRRMKRRKNTGNDERKQKNNKEKS